MVEVYQAIPVAGEVAEECPMGFIQHTHLDQDLGDVFIFADTPTKSLCQDMSSQIKHRLQCPS